ncbi:MAG TPA: 30S ribosomal protein S7 [Patescibacteria group bacterium]|nr:30S ribosomal protein S7 [Patescibacteria group bacterium]
MPRKSRSVNRHAPKPDPKFNSAKYAKFVNYLMERGKKTTAQTIFYTALDQVTEKLRGIASAAQTQEEKDKLPKDGRQVFDLALKNVSPLIEIKGRRVGGANYQVPMEVLEPRRTALGMKWMITAARTRKGMPMAKKLAAEILDAWQKQGAAVKKKEDTHRMAEANKAFAHFARFSRKK